MQLVYTYDQKDCGGDAFLYHPITHLLQCNLEFRCIIVISFTSICLILQLCALRASFF